MDHMGGRDRDRDRRYDRDRRDDNTGDGQNWRSERSTQQIEVSANSWVAEQKKVKTCGDASDIVLRKLRSLLNKLTEENFDRLYAKLKAGETGMSKYSELERLVYLIFEKATTQHNYIPLYVDFIKRLCDDLPSFGIESPDDQAVDFRRLLINVVQDVFEQNRTMPPVPEGLTEEEQFEFILKFKLRFKGNMIFAGKLGAVGLLAFKVIFWCAQNLLQSDAEHDLEAVCVLINTTAEPMLLRYRKKAMNLFSEVSERSKQDQVPKRIQCLLQDTLDAFSRTQFHIEQMGLGSISHNALPPAAENLLQHQSSLPGGAGADAEGFTTVSHKKQRVGGGVMSRVNSGVMGGYPSSSPPSRTSSFAKTSLISSRQKSAGADKEKRSPAGNAPNTTSKKALQAIQEASEARPAAKASSSPTKEAEAEPEPPLDYNGCVEKLKTVKADLTCSGDYREACKHMIELNIPTEHQTTLTQLYFRQLTGLRENERKPYIEWLAQWPGDGGFATETYRSGFLKYLAEDFLDAKEDFPNLPDIITKLCSTGKSASTLCFTEEFLSQVESKMAAQELDLSDLPEK